MWRRIILYTCLYGFFCCNFMLYLYFCNRTKPAIAKDIEATKSGIVFDSTLTCGKKILPIYNKTMTQNRIIGRNCSTSDIINTNIRSNESISILEFVILQIYNETIIQNGTIGKNCTKLNSDETSIRSNDSISTTEGSDQFLEVTSLENIFIHSRNIFFEHIILFGIRIIS